MCGSPPRHRKRSIFYPQRSARLWGPLSPQFRLYPQHSCVGKLAGGVKMSTHLQLNNAWGCAATGTRVCTAQWQHHYLLYFIHHKMVRPLINWNWCACGVPVYVLECAGLCASVQVVCKWCASEVPVYVLVCAGSYASVCKWCASVCKWSASLCASVCKWCASVCKWNASLCASVCKWCSSGL